MSQQYTVPFGEGHLPFSVPVGWDIDVAPGVGQPSEMASSWQFEPPPGLQAAVTEAQRIVIVFTDATRQSPDEQLAHSILQFLQSVGFDLAQVSFLCAVGMHRPSTLAEKRQKLGPDIVERFTVDDHDPAEAITVGAIGGQPVMVNARLMEAGTLVIALGVVEPHQYAGYSGGAKTVVIGCGGADTIAATHSPRFLKHVGTCLGRVQGNPFQAFVRQAGALIGLQWVYNVVLDTDGQIIAGKGGSPAAVHDQLVAEARAVYEVSVTAGYDVVVAGVGAPKDANLYQASRALTYIGLSQQPVIRPGGVIILPVPISEGVGQGIAEQNFMAALQRYTDLRKLVADMDADGCQPGEQRAYMLARVLARHRVIVVGAQDIAAVRAAHLAPVDDIAEAFDLARVWCGTIHYAPRLLIVPHALQTLPIPV
ncbi:lactate racemase domain-containing protein [Chloroflexota bacterium]